MQRMGREREGFWVYGLNPVREALLSEVPCSRLLVAKERAQGAGEVIPLAEGKGLKVETVPRGFLSQLLPGVQTQGLALWVDSFPYRDPLDLLLGEGVPFLVVLDRIQDPRNLGAIMRSAEASGAWGVIIPKDRAVSVTGTVAKASAGACFHLKVARVTNVARTLEELKERGLWTVGAEAGAETSYWEIDLRVPVALVIGGEGEGIRPLVKRKCDFLVSIPMKGRINSLNASVAASLLMYEVLRQREKGR